MIEHGVYLPSGEFCKHRLDGPASHPVEPQFWNAFSDFFIPDEFFFFGSPINEYDYLPIIDRCQTELDLAFFLLSEKWTDSYHGFHREKILYFIQTFYSEEIYENLSLMQTT